MFTTHKNWPSPCGYWMPLVMSQKPVKVFLQIPTVRMERGIGCLGYQTVHQVCISHWHGSHKYTSVLLSVTPQVPNLTIWKAILKRKVEGVSCNHCMKLMSILGEIEISYTRNPTLDFFDAIYTLNICKVCMSGGFLYNFVFLYDSGIISWNFEMSPVQDKKRQKF